MTRNWEVIFQDSVFGAIFAYLKGKFLSRGNHKFVGWKNREKYLRSVLVRHNLGNATWIFRRKFSRKKLVTYFALVRLPVRGITDDVQRANVVTYRISRDIETTTSNFGWTTSQGVTTRSRSRLRPQHRDVRGVRRGPAHFRHTHPEGWKLAGVGGGPTYLLTPRWSTFWTLKALKPTDITRITMSSLLWIGMRGRLGLLPYVRDINRFPFNLLI